MLYFKTIAFPDNTNQTQVEQALRKYALKKTSSLDFKSSTMNIGTDKVFFGLEGKNTLKFTRIKTSFEFMLPKLIINIAKDPNATTYKIRLAAVPFAICIFIAFGIFTIFMGLLNGIINTEVTIFIIALALLFFLLLTAELKLTTTKVQNSIKNALKAVPQH